MPASIASVTSSELFGYAALEAGGTYDAMRFWTCNVSVPLAEVRADAESRVLTRDFVGALRAKVAATRSASVAQSEKS